MLAWIIPIAIVLAFLAASFFGRKYKIRRTPDEVATYIERFVEGSGGPLDWDDFISFAIEDPELEKVRLRCNGLSEEFPPGPEGGYCGAEGLVVLTEMSTQLRKGTL